MIASEITVKRPRTEAETAQDLHKVVQLYVRGVSMRDIAESLERSYGGEVHITLAAIREDIVTIRKEWVNSAMLEFNERKAAELGHLDQLESAYWKAWEDSCKPKTITENVSGTEQVIMGGEKHTLETQSNKKVEQGSDGNPLFLQGVERCIDKRCKILGLFSPETYRIDWRTDVKKLGWSEQEADAIKERTVKNIMELLQRAADDERLASGNIVEAEFSDDEQE